MCSQTQRSAISYNIRRATLKSEVILMVPSSGISKEALAFNIISTDLCKLMLSNLIFTTY